MKMVKSLLLGTAAGLVAVAGAQAADMPVKAAVAYVKICSLYGDGFYYLPGTDICVKIGGYVRAELGFYDGSSTTFGPFQPGSAGFSATTSNGYTDRLDGNDFNFRSRAYISMDTRQQTDYGVLRSYINIGLNFDTGGSAAGNFSGNRAFIQFAGFTVGLAQSFFDFYSVPASSFHGYLPVSDTGDGGWKVAAYTAQWGNGIISTVSLEDPRRTAIVNTNTDGVNPFVIFGGAIDCSVQATGNCNDYIKNWFPDLVNAYRIDQAWGSAQVMWAAHDASAAYYFPAAGSIGANPVVVPGMTCPPAAVVAAAPQGTQVCGHPADKMGWAAGFGARFNVPGLGDYFQFQVTWTKGATRYIFNTPAGGSYGYFSGGTLGQGLLTDGIVNNLTGTVSLTKAFSAIAAYDHLWTRQFRSSVYAAYAKVEYDDVANLSICAIENSSATPGALTAIQNCSNNWGVWFLGSRTQYNFTPAFYVGFDVTYSKLLSADKGLATYTQLAGTQKPSGVYSIQDQDNLAFKVRFHRDILP